jgi:hypothetical protein
MAEFSTWEGKWGQAPEGKWRRGNGVRPRSKLRIWIGVFGSGPDPFSWSFLGLTFWKDWVVSYKAQLFWDGQITVPVANPNTPQYGGPEALLAYQDGKCGSWAEFFLATIYAQGLPGSTGFPAVQLAKIDPLAPTMKVKPGGFLMQGFKRPPDNETYYNTFVKYKKQAGTGQWNYEFKGTPGVPFNQPQAAGQGNLSPLADFDYHEMVLFDFGNQGFKLYDPSYGTIYSGKDQNAALQQFQDRAIVAFYTPTEQPDGTFKWKIKRAELGVLQTKYSLYNPPWFPLVRP